MASISVVIPLYNKQDYIERAISSVLTQTHSAAQIIVVDDGSTDDGYTRVCDQFDNVTLIHQKNAGVSVARNRGIEAATSDYVAFLDADDYWEPEFLQCIAEMIKSFPHAGMFCTHYRILRQNGKVHPAAIKDMPKEPGIINDYFARCYNSDLPITSSSVCVNKSLLEAHGAFPVDVAMGEDQIVWGKLSCEAPLAYYPKTCSNYDQSAEGRVCGQNLVLAPSAQVDFFQEMLEKGQIPNDLKCSVKRLIHLSVLSCVKNNIMSGKRMDGAKLLRLHPGLYWDHYRVAGFASLLIPKFAFSIFYSLTRQKRRFNSFYQGMNR